MSRLVPEADALLGRAGPGAADPGGATGEGQPYSLRERARDPAPTAARVRWAERFAPVFLRALGATLRFSIEGLEALRAARERSPDGRVIYCLWHGSLLPLLYLTRDRGLRILVSRHRDGEIAARVAERLGFRPVRGSTRRGGTRALLEAVRSREPGDLAITTDGPRGPRGHFQPGAVLLAARTGLPLVPVGCAADRSWRLSSWDRFLVPAPFARVRVVLGPPLSVPAWTSAQVRERIRGRAEEALREAERVALGAPAAIPTGSGETA